MEKDLTRGSPWKVIIKFSLPVIGGNLFQLFYTLADTIIVGKTLGAAALAAVGAATTIVCFELYFIQGFTGGFGILLGQAYGEKSQKKNGGFGQRFLGAKHFFDSFTYCDAVLSC